MGKIPIRACYNGEFSSLAMDIELPRDVGGHEKELLAVPPHIEIYDLQALDVNIYPILSLLQIYLPSLQSFLQFIGTLFNITILDLETSSTSPREELAVIQHNEILHLIYFVF